MTKKARRVPMESSPSSSSHPTADEARARFKFRSLLQDYEELLKDTEAKRKTLEKAKQKKTKLLAEIKFLERKHTLLAGNPSQRSQHRIKKKSYRIPSPSPPFSQPSYKTVHCDLPLARKNHRTKEAASTSSAVVLDLNRISLPNDEEMDCQVDWAPPKIEKSSRCAVDEDTVSGDLKLSICRDVQKNPSRIGKRKITWQDQVALKV
ncbi:uncharacterized protein [Typha latifolia]|uniref:uncharacterized protein n=1 Tax=Typha latifolia TaxID=4733 RepID=UPI003C30E8B9